MKRINLLFMTLILMAGCSNEFLVDEQNPPVGDGTAVVFDISVNGVTKSYTDGDFKSFFLPGDTIGVFAVVKPEGGSVTLAESDNYAHNVAYVYQSNGTWKPASYSETIFFPDWGKTLDIYAYYPYIDNPSLNPLNISMSVSAEQSDTTKFNNSDLMSAVNTSVVNKTPVTLVFRHKMAMAEIEFHNDGTASEPDHGIRAELKNIIPAVTLNLASQVVALDNNVSAVNISMRRFEKSNSPDYNIRYRYRAIVPAQTIAENSGIFSYVYQDKNHNYSKNDPLEYKSGEVVRYRTMIPFYIPMEQITPTVNGDGYSFLMGSPDGTGGLNGSLAEPGRSTINEKLHKVKLSNSYKIGRFEITNAQWCAFLNFWNAANPGSEITDVNPQGKYNTSGNDNTWFTLPATSWTQIEYVVDKWRAKPGSGNLPFLNVSYNGAKAFVDFMGYRLPTEAEWEYAARAENQTPFGLGDGTMLYAEMANIDGRSPYNLALGGTITNFLGDAEHINTYRQVTTFVGTFTPNKWNLYDMSGNVWEWAADIFDANYGVAGINITDIYTDPAGAASGVNRVVRGGSWFSNGSSARVANRISNAATFRNNAIGFRIAQ